MSDAQLVIERMLENQEVILLALSKMYLPNVHNSETAQIENSLIDCSHETRRILGKEYIDRYHGI